MNEKIEEDRRQFLSSCALLAASVAAESLLLGGCGSSPASNGGNCLANGGAISVGSASGHTHSAPPVAAADVSASAQKTYTLGNSSGHTHTVTLSAANFASLKNNQGVALQTDSDSTGHTHAITLSCS